MRTFARWSVVLAFCGAVFVTAAQPAFQHAGRRVADAASADATAPSSGFESCPAPTASQYLAAATAVGGPTLIKALGTSPSVVVARNTNRLVVASAHALRAPRLSPHLRSIPLLI